MKNEFLRNEWKNLVSRHSNNGNLMTETFNEIEKCYNSPNRYYHDLHHVKTMLSEVINFRTMFNDPDSVLFAIWFHDVVYDVRRSDNEEKSAEMAEKFLKKIGHDRNQMEKVKKLILNTKNHSNFDLKEDFDFKIFLDLDLLILGEENEIYQEYSANVRKEYSFVPENIYAIERIKILENFLSQDFIFKTDQIQKKYERKARANLKSEIAHLSAI